MAALTYLAGLVQARSGIIVGPDKQYLLESRLAPLLRREHLAGFDQLVDRLGHGGCDRLEQDIAEAVATGETLFFRDSRAFEHLRTSGLPELLRARARGTKLRLWSAAASTGQETYSLAITLSEYGLGDGGQAEVLGSDLGRHPVEHARAGLYSQYDVQRGLSVQRLLRFFMPNGPQWQVRDDLRALCRFRQWNLLHDPAPLGLFDVVFCRNVLFYFARPVRTRVLALIRRQMAPDGLLYLGAAETAEGLDDQLERDGPAYRLRARGLAADQAIAPRAVIGHRHSTRSSLTPTYQSYRSTVGSQ